MKTYLSSSLRLTQMRLILFLTLLSGILFSCAPAPTPAPTAAPPTAAPKPASTIPPPATQAPVSTGVPPTAAPAVTFILATGVPTQTPIAIVTPVPTSNPQGNARVDYPLEMLADASDEIVFYVAPNRPLAGDFQSAGPPRENINVETQSFKTGKRGIVMQNEVTMYTVMSAELFADGFAIGGESKPQVRMMTASGARWSWTLTAKKIGNQSFSIRLCGEVNENNPRCLYEIAKIGRGILVLEKPIFDRLRQGISENFLAMMGILISAGGLILAYLNYSASRSKKRAKK